MSVLSPAIQVFGIQAGEYLAGVDEAAAQTDAFAASIERAAGAAGGLDASTAAGAAGLDAEAAAFERDLAAAGMMIDAKGRLRLANGQFASSEEIAAAGLDTESAAAERAGVAVEASAGKTAVASKEAAGFGSAMKTALLGVAVAAVYGVDKAAEFQSSMEQLHTQAGVAQGKIAGLSQQVLQLSSQVGYGPESLSESLYHVASNMESTGATGAQMMSALKVAAEGAQVGNANLEDETNALGAAIASGIPGVQNYTSAMGMMNATVGAGDMRMQDLADAFGTGVLANIKMYGVTLQDVSAALATFGDNNIRGAKAGTDLRMAVQAIVQPVSTAKASLERLGLTTTSLADAMKKGGLNGALELFISRLKAAHVSTKDYGEIITDVFGKKAGSGIGVLVGEFDRFQGKYAAVKKGADEFAGDWADRQKTMAQQWANLKSGAEALAVSFGTVLLPAATKVVGALAKFGTFLEQHPALAAFAGAILAVAVAFKVVAAAEAIFDAVTDANPVMLVVIAIIALIAGLYELYTHFKVVRDIVADVGHFFKATWEMAMRAAGAVIKWFEAGPLKDIQRAIAYFRQWWAQNGAEVEQIWRGVWGVIKAVFTIWWTIISTEFKLGLAILLDIWKVVWGAVRDYATWVWNVIKAEITMAIHIIMDVISIVLDLITGHWGKAWSDCKKLFHDAINGVENIGKAWAKGFLKFWGDLGKNVIQGFINGMKSMFGAAGSIVKGFGGSIVGGLKSALSIFSPSKATYQLGVYVAQGLADGIASSTAPASAASKMAYDLLDAIRGATAAGVISLGRASALTQWVDADNNRLQSLATQRANIAKTIAAAQKYAATTTSNTEQAFGLMNAAGSTPLTAGDIATALRQDVSQIVAFKNNIKKLAKMGLNKAYIDQLIQAGPVSGGQVAAELAAGSWADIKSINSAESAIASASTSLGQTAANAMYDSGKMAGKGFLSGLEAQQAAISKMMAQIAQSAINAVKRELGISSPSRVFMEHGKAVVDGFVLGLEGGTGRVEDASRMLAGAASMPHGGISGIGSGGGGGTINVHLTVNGFVGSNRELVNELGYELQHWFLQNNHRNPTNGLSLAFGR